MKPAAMLPLLERWATVQLHAESTWDRLENLTDFTDSESPLGKAVWDTFQAYTDALALAIGDTGGWLDYFHLEGQMGARVRTVTVRPGARPRQLRTLRQLATIIHLTSAP